MDGQCVPCGKGLSCPIGSTIAGLTLLPSANAKPLITSKGPILADLAVLGLDSLALIQIYDIYAHLYGQVSTGFHDFSPS